MHRTGGQHVGQEVRAHLVPVVERLLFEDGYLGGNCERDESHITHMLMPIGEPLTLEYARHESGVPQVRQSDQLQSDVRHRLLCIDARIAVHQTDQNRRRDRHKQLQMGHRLKRQSRVGLSLSSNARHRRTHPITVVVHVAPAN